MSCFPIEMRGVTGRRGRDGGISFTVPFGPFDTLTELFVFIPPFWQGLQHTGEVAVATRESGSFEATATYEGVVVTGGPLDYLEGDGEWEVDPEMGEEPLETHPLLGDILAEYSGYIDEDGKVRFPERIQRFQRSTAGYSNTSPARKGLFETGGSSLRDGDANPAFGFETYLLPGAIVRRTRVLPSVPSDLMRRAGEIIKELPIEALRGVDWGDADWLTLQARPSSFGNGIRLVEEWQKSKPGGWLPIVQGLIDQR